MLDRQTSFYTLLVLLSGTLITLITKQIDLTKSNNEHFTHPYFQTSLMFLGESLCFIYLQCKTPTSFTKSHLSFAVPALFDLIASTLSFIGLILSTASVYQMMRGFIIVIVSFYSVIFLKEKIFFHQFIGIFSIFIGISLVGLSSLSSTSLSSKDPFLGVVVLLFSQFFAGGIYVTEQYLIKILNLEPLHVIGLEGCAGFMFYLVLLPLFNLIRCEDKDFCNFGYIENSLRAFEDIFSSALLSFFIILFMLLTAVFNVSGVYITKYSGAVARTTIDTSRTILVWMLSLSFGWEEFSFIQLLGFAFIVLGTLVFNEVLVFKVFGIERSVFERKKYLAHKENTYVGIELEEGYQ